jgi:hypothetical protein
MSKTAFRGRKKTAPENCKKRLFRNACARIPGAGPRTRGGKPLQQPWPAGAISLRAWSACMPYEHKPSKKAEPILEALPNE